ncbi:periodic tryptophan protein 2-like protein [Iris pallida]|uniref:Periodic tryptophan protein 2-like protein n=1 Tax=Iris pallida TaxID=29817 RepID=A0AAX6E212_IRIPA|nr:periodic tryptophan protein 2-like protein [Iris pallida]
MVIYVFLIMHFYLGFYSDFQFVRNYLGLYSELFKFCFYRASRETHDCTSKGFSYRQWQQL